MLAALSVLRSRATRILFFSSAIITAGILLWAQYFLPAVSDRLTQIFFLLFMDFDVKAARWTLAVLLIAVFVSGAFPGARLLDWISENMPLVAVSTVTLLSAGSLFVYRNHPLSMDEYAQYLQSQIFASGKLSGQFPVALMDWLVPPGFQNYFISVSKSTGSVASGYWPSFALLLTPFTALGIPWACNPAISALTLLGAHKLALKIYDDRQAAAIVVLLTAASPEFFVNGISYYSMPAHLLANTVFALLLLEPTRKKVLLAGVVGSIALTLHNPFPHMLFAMPWILWVARRSDAAHLILRMVAGYTPLCLVLGIGWFWFTGHLRDGTFQTVSVFSLPDASVFLARAIGMAKIWIWGVPGLIILAVAGAWKGWMHPAVRLLTFSALLTLLGFFLVPVDQGHGWGYRYFHTAWIVLPLLAAGALTRSKSGRGRATFEDEDSRAFVISCAVLMLVIGVTLRAVQVRGFMMSDLAQLPAYAGTERRIVMVDPRSASYGSDLVQNDPWLRGGEVRMLSHGREADARMMALNFPELREIYDDPHGTVWSGAVSGEDRQRSNLVAP